MSACIGTLSTWYGSSSSRCCTCSSAALFETFEAIMHSDHADDPHAEHGVAKYIYVFVALCVLTTMSFLTYSHFWPAALSDPHVKWLFMMAVSCTKAMLVILFFMHLKSEANWKY